MARQSNQVSRTKSEKEFLRRLNATQLTGSRLMQFATEVQALPKDDRDFEGSVITAIRFFSGDPDAVLSSHYRMVALAVLVVDGVPGWASDMNAEGAIKTHPALFEAAARAPLVWFGNEIRFRRASFLRIAFQEAKRAA